jgi:hypothetical protein
MKFRQRGRERTHAGQHDAAGALQLFWIRRQLCFGADMAQRPLHRMHIADSVVDDRYQPNSPFDEGTPGPPPCAIAERSARPSALNVASAMWCRLRPRITSTWIVAPT